MLAFRLLWRDWRSGELKVLAAAVILAVAIVTSIGLFVERLQGGILDSSRDFLAADIALQSPRALNPLWLERAREIGLQHAETLRFQSMVYAGDEMQLASVKAVSGNYPLKGHLQIGEQLLGERNQVSHGPPAGEVWIDSRLLPLLQIALGDTLQVGDYELKVTALVYSEPDQGSNLTSFGPRVLMHRDDIEATGIVRPGSQVRYRFLFAGTRQALEEFIQWVTPQFSASQRWLDVKNTQPTVSAAMNRAESFLLLGGSLGVLLAAVAAALAAYRYSERHFDYAALMKCLGASAQQIRTIYLQMLLLVTFVAVLLGWLAGWMLQALFIAVVSQFLSIELPSGGLQPFFMGGVSGLVCVISFALPPIWSLQNIPPLRVLRRDIEGQRTSLVVSVLLGSLGITGLMLWYSASIALTLAVLAGVLISAFCLILLGWVILRSSRLVGMQASSAIGLALANLRRRAWLNAIHIFIFSLAIMLLLILTLVRTTLVDDWQTQLPEGTPNHFLINIAAHEVEPVNDWLNENSLAGEGLYPMVRGRLSEINGEPVLKRISREQLHQAGADREMNLTWAAQLPVDNIIDEGQWWTDSQRSLAAISLEKNLARNLGISLGDRVSFQVGAASVEARVQSIRSLQWQTMRPNFYVIFKPGALEAFPATFITSFYLPTSDRHILHTFIRQFPTITLVEIDPIIQQVRQIINQVGLAIELLLGLIIAAGALVLVASVQNSIGERYRECAILRALGAKKRRVLGALVIEFAVLGLLAGVLAVAGAELSVFLLQTRIFQMPYNSHVELWGIGPALGFFLITAIGYFATRRVVSTAPIEVLRDVEH